MFLILFTELQEDNKVNQMVAERLLNNLGCSVDVACNGVEAIELLERSTSSYDIIFMDCHMPVRTSSLNWCTQHQHVVSYTTRGISASNRNIRISSTIKKSYLKNLFTLKSYLHLTKSVMLISSKLHISRLLRISCNTFLVVCC